MSDHPDPDQVRATLDPVWFNAYWVENALGLYEGVSKHADLLSVNYNHFFALVQKFSLDSAVIGICKLFDTGSPAYQKDTIPDLFAYLGSHFTSANVSRVNIDTLKALGISETDSSRLAGDLKSAFHKAKAELLGTVQNLMPKRDEDKALSKLIIYRNKVAAHQERLDDDLKEQFKSLPSLHDMERLNEWAINFCLLSNSLLTGNITLIRSGTSSRMSALNVAVKLLDKKFGTPEERKSFYGRI